MLLTAGAEIYIVYIPSGGEKCPSYLESIASLPTESHYFPIMVSPYYDQLTRPDFISNLLIQSCLEMVLATPATICYGSRRTSLVTLHSESITQCHDSIA
jgi:hypothetical protein